MLNVESLINYQSMFVLTKLIGTKQDILTKFKGKEKWNNLILFKFILFLFLNKYNINIIYV